MFAAALAYVESAETPAVLRRRVAVLARNGCKNAALNLAAWCLRSASMAQDHALIAFRLKALYTPTTGLTAFHDQVSTHPYIRLLLSTSAILNAGNPKPASY